MSEFSESIESPEITDEAITDFIERGGEAPPYHAILKVWHEVLKPAAGELEAKVTPQWANRMVQSYPCLTYADVEKVRDAYFSKIIQLSEILDLEIASDDECLNPTTPEEDVEQNSHHYKNLLLNWQLAVLQWELDWECTSPDAAAEIAAISETHKMFFGATGITAYLDNIRFEFTEDDQATLAQALQELKDGQ